MFDFKIINLPDGSQVINHKVKTPCNSLSAAELEEYIQVDEALAYIERIKKMEQRDAENKKRQKKLAKNPLWRLAYFCGIV